MVGSGRYKEAEEAFRKGLEIQPKASRFHSLPRHLDIFRIAPHRPWPMRDWRQKVSGATMPSLWCNKRRTTDSAADATLKDFIARNSNGGAFQIAVLYAIRKEPDEMFKWLDTAYATRDSGLVAAGGYTFLPPLRDDPRFTALCQKLNVQLPSAPAKQ